MIGVAYQSSTSPVRDHTGARDGYPSISETSDTSSTSQRQPRCRQYALLATPRGDTSASLPLARSQADDTNMATLADSWRLVGTSSTSTPPLLTPTNDVPRSDPSLLPSVRMVVGHRNRTTRVRLEHVREEPHQQRKWMLPVDEFLVGRIELVRMGVQPVRRSGERASRRAHVGARWRIVLPRTVVLVAPADHE